MCTGLLVLRKHKHILTRFSPFLSNGSALREENRPTSMCFTLADLCTVWQRRRENRKTFLHLGEGLIICKSFKRSRTFNNEQASTSKPRRLRQEFQPSLGYIAESCTTKKKERKKKEKEAERIVETRQVVPRRKYRMYVCIHMYNMNVSTL